MVAEWGTAKGMLQMQDPAISDRHHDRHPRMMMFRTRSGDHGDVWDSAGHFTQSHYRHYAM
jgi:hypothetical protein